MVTLSQTIIFIQIKESIFDHILTNRREVTEYLIRVTHKNEIRCRSTSFYITSGSNNWKFFYLNGWLSKCTKRYQQSQNLLNQRRGKKVGTVEGDIEGEIQCLYDQIRLKKIQRCKRGLKVNGQLYQKEEKTCQSE